MTHVAKPAFAHSSGSRTARIAIVGEAWGQNEALLGVPFVGFSGLELARVLHEAGIVSEAPPDASLGLSNAMMMNWWARRTEVFTTNVFAMRPGADNKIENLCGKKAEVGGDAYPLPPFRQGHYFKPEYFGELARLAQEIESVRPNLVLTVGNSAAWAFTGNAKISQIRGTVQTAQYCVPGVKVLPTFHPAYILRDWSKRSIMLADCMKARREAQSPEITRPARRILVDPTIDEVETWTARILVSPPAILASDIETVKGQIEMVSFAPSRGEAIVVPFLDPRKPDWNYWPTAELEARAWACVATLCASSIEKLYQNGLYDLQYKARRGLRVMGVRHDTMILHHALYPELQKSLGFMGSIYTDEVAWKLMRRAKADTEKREE